jgi:hypothetical protein
MDPPLNGEVESQASTAAGGQAWTLSTLMQLLGEPRPLHAAMCLEVCWRACSSASEYFVHRTRRLRIRVTSTNVANPAIYHWIR